MVVSPSDLGLLMTSSVFVLLVFLLGMYIGRNTMWIDMDDITDHDDDDDVTRA